MSEADYGRPYPRSEKESALWLEQETAVETRDHFFVVCWRFCFISIASAV